MSLSSAAFMLFLISVITVYYLVPKRVQWVVLLIGSYFYYLTYGYKIVGFLLFTTLTTYSGGLLLGRINNLKKEQFSKLPKDITSEEKKALSDRYIRNKKWVIACVLLINFGILAAIKYYNFTAENLNLVLDFISDFSFPKLTWLLPVGLSFYIFQSAGYVIDVYRAKYQPERSFFKYALFVSFFPQIIQGPISRYDQLAHQLYAKHSFSFDRLKYGIQLMMWGFFKKLVIADRTAVIVNNVFSDFQKYSGSEIAFGVFMYCIQIYCDFSGGIDIIRGIAQILGVDMIENFQRPYFATSLSDFWRRWHISLGAWMRDYLFYPLSLSKPFAKLGKFARKRLKGNLGKILPVSVVTFIVFFTIGIWHGASWKYIAFGVWNGGIITFSVINAPLYAKILKKLHINPDSLYWRIFQIVRTTFLVFIGRYFTRGDDLMTALRMIKRTVLKFDINALFVNMFGLGLGLFDLLVVFVCVIVVLFLGYLKEKGVSIRKTLEQKNMLVQWVVILAGLGVIMFLGIYREGYIASEFIYKQY